MHSKPPSTRIPNSILIRWIPPFTAGDKLNTDGCLYESNRKVGFGGLFRDHVGMWLLGYYGKLNCNSRLETELWGIYRGLTIMLEKGYSNVQIESDSLMAVQLINEGATGYNLHHALALDSNVLLRRTQSTLTHIYREANSSAGHMPRLGAEQHENLVVTEEAPNRCTILCLKMAWELAMLGTSSFLLL